MKGNNAKSEYIFAQQFLFYNKDDKGDIKIVIYRVNQDLIMHY